MNVFISMIWTFTEVGNVYIDDEDDEMSEMKSSNSILTWKYWFQF